MSLNYTPEFLSRFWSKITITADDEQCWNWTAGKSNGYGRIGFENRQLITSRVAYELTFGEIPDGLFVLHKCDNPACCNPKHLFLGTQRINMDDRSIKGRQPKGIKNGRSKLTENDVVNIRKRYAEGNITLEMLGYEYGVNHSTLSNIIHRRYWKHI